MTSSLAAHVAATSELQGKRITGTPYSDYNLTGGEGPDTIEGLGGSDIIRGRGGDDVLNGGADWDRILGDGGNDTISGGDGGDSLSGDDGDDVLSGEAGSDWLYGGWGDDSMDGGADDDNLEGSDGNDTIVGGWGNDRLDGGWGSDSLSGGSGSDTLVVGHHGNDTLDGGDGNDSLLNGPGANRLIGGAGDDQFTYVSGSQGQSTLSGGVGRDTFEIGYDALTTEAVADVITDFTAGPGGDVIDLTSLLSRLGTFELGYPNPFATGHLRLQRVGADTHLEASVTGRTDPSDTRTVLILRGIDPASLTVDNLYPSYQPIRIATAPTEEHDALHGTSGEDAIDGLGGNDTIMGHAGDDILMGGAGADNLMGGIGSDTMVGGTEADSITGSEGDDWLIGGEGHDWIIAGAGDDLLDGGDGNDSLSAADGSDVLAGGDGNDSLSGGTGGDIIQGGGGSDLIEMEGQDLVTGGQDADRFRLDDFAAAVGNPGLIRDFEGGYGGDVLDLSRAIDAVDPRYDDSEYGWLQDPVHPFTSGLLRVVASGNDTLVQVDLGWIDKGQGYGTILRLSNVAPDELNAYNFHPAHHPLGQISIAVGTDGNDTMAGSLGDDAVSGLGGDDSLQGSDGKDLIDGGAGNDTIGGGLGDDTIHGGAGDDHIDGDPPFYGGDRWSPIPKQGGNDYIDGGDGNDHFYEWQGGSNTIIGGAGDDVFHYVSGEADWDGYETVPALSLDWLTGGEGRDTYLIGHTNHAPADVVTDFATGPGGDILDVSGLLWWLAGYVPGTNPFLTGHLVLEQDGTTTVLKALVAPYWSEPRLEPILTLENTRAGDLTYDNFVPPYDPSGTFGAVNGSAADDVLAGTMQREFIEERDDDDDDGGDVINLTDMTGRLQGLTAGADLFEAGLSRRTESEDDTWLEALFQEKTGFASILGMENSVPELLPSVNVDWMA